MSEKQRARESRRIDRPIGCQTEDPIPRRTDRGRRQRRRHCHHRDRPQTGRFRDRQNTSLCQRARPKKWKQTITFMNSRLVSVGAVHQAWSRRLMTRADLASVDGVAAASAEGAEQKRLPWGHVYALSGPGALDHTGAHTHWSIRRYVQICA